MRPIPPCTLEFKQKLPWRARRMLKKLARKAAAAPETWTITLVDGSQYSFVGRLKYPAWRRFLDWLIFWKDEPGMRLQIMGPPKFTPADLASPPGSSLQGAHRQPGRGEQLEPDLASPGTAGGDE